MLRRFRMSFFAFVALALALPTLAAAEPVASLPAIQPTQSARFEVANAFNGAAFIVGRGEVIAPDAIHYVLRTVPAEGEAEESFEVVIIDGQVYYRQNDAGEWNVDFASGPVLDPAAEQIAGAEAAGPLERIGSVEIAGVPTEQYQVLASNNGTATRPYATADWFIGQTTPWLYQSQITEYNTDPEFGDYRLESVIRTFDHGDPSIKITAPDGVDVAPIRGPVPWSLAARPNVGQILASPTSAAAAWRDALLFRKGIVR